MKIAVVTPGRSHLLNMAKEHIRNGHEVTFYTMVSKSRCEKFGLPRKNVVSFFFFCAPLMLLFRKLHLPGDWNREIYYRVVRIVDFLASKRLKKCDVFIGISGCTKRSAKKAKEKYNAIFICDRGCKHILAQDEILKATPNAEQVFPKDIPYELWQYEHADYMALPSQHSKESFTDHGVPAKKLFVNPYGVNLSWFKPTILSKNDSYDVIMVGIWMMRKGVDLLEKACRKEGLRLLHVGPISPDCKFPESESMHHIDPVNEQELPSYYARAKVLCLPSREDGFGLVLFQAMACGLPLVYSHNTGGPDLKRLVNDKEYLFEMPEYTAESLAETLKKALKKADSQPAGEPRNYLSEEALVNISWEAYGKRYNEFLKSIAAER